MTTITIDRAVVEQALEALESLFNWKVDSERGKRCGDAVVALRAALAQQALPAQEPTGRVVSANCEYATVQWLKQTSDVGGGDPKNSRSWPIAGDAVYTAPPQRKPLMDEEIVRIAREAGLGWDDKYHWYVGSESLVRFARLIHTRGQA